jgi:hypothetical protein
LLGLAAKDGMVLQDQEAVSRGDLTSEKQGSGEPADGVISRDGIVGTPSGPCGDRFADRCDGSCFLCSEKVCGPANVRLKQPTSMQSRPNDRHEFSLYLLLTTSAVITH